MYVCVVGPHGEQHGDVTPLQQGRWIDRPGMLAISADECTQVQLRTMEEMREDPSFPRLSVTRANSKHTTVHEAGVYVGIVLPTDDGEDVRAGRGPVHTDNAYRR